MRVRLVATVLVAVLGGCSSVARVVTDLDRESPPSELGRPDWVRYPAVGGAWLGGAVGAVGSLVTLPLTLPLSLVAERPLGYARDDFLLWGVALGAGTGHVVVGAPFDTADFVFRRAWVEAAGADPPPQDSAAAPSDGQ